MNEWMDDWMDGWMDEWLDDGSQVVWELVVLISNS